eukprot:1162903-Amphidinium_carterae.1
MLEGRWDTWSYADLMIPEAFFEMLMKDSVRQEKLDMAQKQFKWAHIIEPLCASLGYQLMFSEERSIFPHDGVGYYQLMADGKITSVTRCIRVPDASIQVNHELIHYVAQSFDCANLLQLWRERAEKFVFFDGLCRFPYSIENKNDKQRQ